MRFMWKDVGLSLSIASGTWGITLTEIIIVNKDTAYNIKFSIIPTPP